MRVLSGPRRGLSRVAISPDGAEVAGCGFGPLHVWRDGRRTDLVADGAENVAYTPDGRWLVCRRFSYGAPAEQINGLFVLDRRGDRPPHRLAGGYLLAADGDRLYLRDDAERAIRCVRVADAPPFPVVWRRDIGREIVPLAAAVLPGGRVLLSSWHHGAGRVVEEMDADTGVIRSVVPDLFSGLVAVSPDGGRLVAHHGTHLLIWATDRLDASPVELPPGRRAVREVVWHPSGAYLLGVRSDGEVVRLDPAGGRPTPAFRPPGGKALTVAIAPDGLTAAVGTSQGKVVVFDLD